MHRCRNCNTAIDTGFLTHCHACGTPISDAVAVHNHDGNTSPGRWKSVLFTPLLGLVLVAAGMWFGLDEIAADRDGPLVRATRVDVTNLRVGDCVDLPDVDGDVFGSVLAVPCDSPHQLEKYLDAIHPASPGTEWPGFDDLSEWATRSCYDGFESYVGRAFEEVPHLDFYFVVPAQPAWDEGERTSQCFVMRADQSTMTGSVAGSH